MIIIKSFILNQTNWLEVTWAEEGDIQIYCESFSGHSEHIAMLRAKANEYGTSLNDFEYEIAECIANFVYPDEPTAEEIAQQLRAEKLASFNASWDSLKIGYDETAKEAFQVKYGNELGGNHVSSTLYNCNTLVAVESTDHIYKCSQDNINLLTEKKSSQYSSSDGSYWYGSLGVHPLDSIELGVVLLKANELVQSLADSILGAE